MERPDGDIVSKDELKIESQSGSNFIGSGSHAAVIAALLDGSGPGECSPKQLWSQSSPSLQTPWSARLIGVLICTPGEDIADDLHSCKEPVCVCTGGGAQHIAFEALLPPWLKAATARCTMPGCMTGCVESLVLQHVPELGLRMTFPPSCVSAPGPGIGTGGGRGTSDSVDNWLTRGCPRASAASPAQERGPGDRVNKEWPVGSSKDPAGGIGGAKEGSVGNGDCGAPFDGDDGVETEVITPAGFIGSRGADKAR